MLVGLPPDPESRKRLFKLLQDEEDDFGEDFCVTPNGRSGREMTREEAIAEGDPGLEGYWLEEMGPIQDVGQTVLSLWLY
jgi:hypothetical protein